MHVKKCCFAVFFLGAVLVGYAQPSVPEPQVNSKLILLIYGDNGIYAYPAGQIDEGKKYTYKQIDSCLSQAKCNPKLHVVIHPSANSTYRNAVSIIDKMKEEGIINYELTDIEKIEETYLKRASITR